MYGRTKITQAGNLEPFGKVFFIPGGNINILSCSKLVKRRFNVNMAETQDRFLVSRAGIETLEFIQGQNGLYSLLLKASDDYPEAQEAGAVENISDAQRTRAKNVLELQAALGYPSDEYLKERSNMGSSLDATSRQGIFV